MTEKLGRPSKYTEALARDICLRLAEGESLRSICRDDDMPKASTVRGWVVDDRHGFSEQYARARDLGLDCMADELLEIADEPIYGERIKTKANGDQEIIQGDTVERSKLKVDARKWYLSKLAPKRYGDKLEVEGSMRNYVISGEPMSEDEWQEQYGETN